MISFLLSLWGCYRQRRPWPRHCHCLSRPEGLWRFSLCCRLSVWTPLLTEWMEPSWMEVYSSQRSDLWPMSLPNHCQTWPWPSCWSWRQGCLEDSWDMHWTSWRRSKRRTSLWSTYCWCEPRYSCYKCPSNYRHHHDESSLSTCNRQDSWPLFF